MIYLDSQLHKLLSKSETCFRNSEIFSFWAAFWTSLFWERTVNKIKVFELYFRIGFEKGTRDGVTKLYSVSFSRQCDSITNPHCQNERAQSGEVYVNLLSRHEFTSELLDFVTVNEIIFRLHGHVNGDNLKKSQQFYAIRRIKARVLKIWLRNHFLMFQTKKGWKMSFLTFFNLFVFGGVHFFENGSP